MENKFTVDYFIKKFEAIPEEKWGVGSFLDERTGRSCAYGHCGARDFETESDEVNDLGMMFIRSGIGTVVCINDGKSPLYEQTTPKQRILAALYDIKKMQGPIEQDAAEKPEPVKEVRREIKVEREIIIVEMDSKARELTKELIYN